MLQGTNTTKRSEIEMKSHPGSGLGYILVQLGNTSRRPFQSAILSNESRQDERSVPLISIVGQRTTGSTLLDSFTDGNRPKPNTLVAPRSLHISSNIWRTLGQQSARAQTALPLLAIVPKSPVQPTESYANSASSSTDADAQSEGVPSTKEPVQESAQPAAKSLEPASPSQSEAEPTKTEPTKAEPRTASSQSSSKSSTPSVDADQSVSASASDTAQLNETTSLPSSSGAAQAVSVKLRQNALVQAVKPTAGQSAIVSDAGQRAREAAASVGLLDLEDTLLFGGDSKVAGINTYTSSQVPSDRTGVLTYIARQITAFNAAPPKATSLIVGNLGALNRAEEPTYRTVLKLKDFQLSDLDGLTQNKLNESTESDTSPSASAPSDKSERNQEDVATLSQQVESLNRQIALLSKKLAEVSSGKGK